jgi:hypothetical protein
MRYICQLFFAVVFLITVAIKGGKQNKKTKPSGRTDAAIDGRIISNTIRII